MRIMFFILVTGLLLNSKSAEDYISDGQELSSAGNFKSAILVFENAINKNPFLKDAYIQLGQCS